MCFANGPMLPEVDDATLQQTSEWWDMLPDMAAGAPGAPPAQQVYPGSSAGSAPHVDTPVEDAGGLPGELTGSRGPPGACARRSAG